MSHTDNLLPTMQAHSKPQYEMESTSFTPVNAQLQTPEEPIAHSFSLREQTPTPSRDFHLPPMQTASPPLSPMAGYASVDASMRDAPLFPESQSERRGTQSPLFRNTDGWKLPSAAELAKLNPEPEPVNEGEYCRFPWSHIKTAQGAAAYLESCQRELDSISAAKRPRLLLEPNEDKLWDKRDPTSRQQLLRLERPAGVAKQPAQSKSVAARTPSSHRHTPSVGTSSVRSTASMRRRTPKPKTMTDFHNEAFPAQQSKHKRKAPSKDVGDPRVPWREIPDYAPPISTLDDDSNQFHFETYPGNKLDISQMEDVEALHPKERAMATLLRLEPVKYMTSKRKIFRARLQSLREDKAFNKTMAQGACGIDVNKASRLRDAFDSIGWLDKSWFEEWL